MYLVSILSLRRSKCLGCWLLTRGLGLAFPSPPWNPSREAGERELHLFRIDACITHTFLTFFVDGQSQLGQLKSILTTQQQETDLWESFPTPKGSSSSETNPTPEFSQIYFTQASDKHAVFIPGFILRLESSLVSGANTTRASLCGLDNLKWWDDETWEEKKEKNTYYFCTCDYLNRFLWSHYCSNLLNWIKMYAWGIFSNIGKV